MIIKLATNSGDECCEVDADRGKVEEAVCDLEEQYADIPDEEWVPKTEFILKGLETMFEVTTLDVLTIWD